MSEGIPYPELPQLKDLYLEDSFTIAVELEDHALHVAIELVLTESHPEYHPPRPGGVFCYRRGVIAIEGARATRWIAQDMQPSTDADGEVDYGGIWSWSLRDGVWAIDADWGQLEVDGGQLSVALLPDTVGG